MTRERKALCGMIVGNLHCLKDNEIIEIQKSLLNWYITNQRTLPWRTIAASEKDCEERAYAVWVSEIMLQQTQVATVVNYFNEWMKKWPTVGSLSSATLEEVNQIWAGLGYYSRAKRLHEGAIKISNDLNGAFPQDRESLQKELPGVGRYTASAIASIAMKQPVGVVDGNVLRVLARVRAIGGDISSQAVVDEFWKLADQLVDKDAPGDFNQALMELGATVCTPKNPSCGSCPLRETCVALAITEADRGRREAALVLVDKEKRRKPLIDIECVPGCELCLKKSEWNEYLGVQNFPRKSKKTAVKDKTCAVVVIKDGRKETPTYLFVQRPKKGLLANLWEFASASLFEGSESDRKATSAGSPDAEEVVRAELEAAFGLSQKATRALKFVGDVTHIFSHIHQTYKVYELVVEKDVDLALPENYQGWKWMGEEEFVACATSTAMKKVLKAYNFSLAARSKNKDASGKRALQAASQNEDKKQPKLSHFFSPVPAKRK